MKSRTAAVFIVGLLVGGIVTWAAFSVNAPAPSSQTTTLSSPAGRDLTGLTALLDNRLVQSWWVVLAGEVQAIDGTKVTLDFNNTDTLSFETDIQTGYLLPAPGESPATSAERAFSLNDLRPGGRGQGQARSLSDGLHATFIQTLVASAPPANQ